MDLLDAVSGLQQAKVMGQVQMAVARRIMSVQRLQGSAAIELLQAATEGASKAGDQLVAEAIGLGGQIDTYG
jgi:hypothetical protein